TPLPSALLNPPSLPLPSFPLSPHLPARAVKRSDELQFLDDVIPERTESPQRKKRKANTATGSIPKRLRMEEGEGSEKQGMEEGSEGENEKEKEGGKGGEREARGADGRGGD